MTRQIASLECACPFRYELASGILKPLVLVAVEVEHAAESKKCGHDEPDENVLWNPAERRS
jgi:hypothetical protein